MTEVPYTNDPDTLRQWVGRSQELTDTISVDGCRKLQHTLDHETTLANGDVLPPLWHFISHIDAVRTGRLGRDGHPERGGFLPPVALPRRMWAGSRVTFHNDVIIGAEVSKTSTITDVKRKDGRSGALCFVTLHHELSTGGEVLVSEEQDLVYREDPDPDAAKPDPKPAPAAADFTRTITPSEVMLFRYSALTFNSHRIHYDRDYARDVEGYNGLVFHGPLTATLLADMAVDEAGAKLASFSFRGLAPLLDDQPFTISGADTGDGLELWAVTPDGGLAMQATATFVAD